MSYDAGMACFNLEMTDAVPRTEYSAEGHWPLIKRLCGIDGSVPGNEGAASAAFMRAWDYSMRWNVLTHGYIFGDTRTSMGHAVYAYNGTDRNDAVYCPFKDEDEVLRFDPQAVFGTHDPATLTAEYNAHFRDACAYFPDAVNMTGIYVTCMSGLIELFGWDMLLSAAGTDPGEFGAMTLRYGAWIQQYFDALARCDSPVIMVHDDIVWTSGAFLHPDWYRRFIFPNYRRYFAPLHEAGKIILYTSDGDYTEFIDDVAACGVSGFVMEPTTDMRYIAEKYGRTHSFVGNADTRVLLGGSRDDIEREVRRCMDIGKPYPGFMMAVGNHIPANTPVEACLWYDECYRKLGRR